MNTEPKFKIGDLVQLTEDGKRAFPTKVLTLPWKVVNLQFSSYGWQIRVEHQGQRVNRLVRETLNEFWLEKA